MKIEVQGMAMYFIRNLEVNFSKTWIAIGEDLQNELLRGSFQYLRLVCDHSDFHQSIYAMLLGIFQNLILEAENPAWKILHQFILDGNLPASGRDNGVWIVLGIVGQLLGRPSYQCLVNDCIYMLLKNMSTGVLLDQVSLNIAYYENLDVDSAIKQAGIGFFALLGTHMPFLWSMCCRQLQRLMDEEDGLLKAIKFLIGMFDFRHCGEFIKESTQECDDLVANVLERASRNKVLNMSPSVKWIQEAYIRDNDKGYTGI